MIYICIILENLYSIWFTPQEVNSGTTFPVSCDLYTWSYVNNIIIFKKRSRCFMVIEKINKEIEKIEKKYKGKHDNGLYGTIVTNI